MQKSLANGTNQHYTPDMTKIPSSQIGTIREIFPEVVYIVPMTRDKFLITLEGDNERRSSVLTILDWDQACYGMFDLVSLERLRDAAGAGHVVSRKLLDGCRAILAGQWSGHNPVESYTKLDQIQQNWLQSRWKASWEA